MNASPVPVAVGRVGAGTGATVGTLWGLERGAPGGLGSAAVEVAGAKVAGLAVVNAAGNVVDPSSGRFVAGAQQAYGDVAERLAGTEGTNTTLMVVATDAAITKAQARRLADSAHSGLARTIQPANLFEGDTSFVLSTGTGPEVAIVALSVAVQEVVVRSILSAVTAHAR